MVSCQEETPSARRIFSNGIPFARYLIFHVKLRKKRGNSWNIPRYIRDVPFRIQRRAEQRRARNFLERNKRQEKPKLRLERNVPFPYFPSRYSWKQTSLSFDISRTPRSQYRVRKPRFPVARGSSKQTYTGVNTRLRGFAWNPEKSLEPAATDSTYRYPLLNRTILPIFIISERLIVFFISPRSGSFQASESF